MLKLSVTMAIDCLCIMTNVLPFIWNNVNVLFPFIDMNSEVERAIGFLLIEAFRRKAVAVPF